jgi:hypothetical protein
VGIDYREIDQMSDQYKVGSTLQYTFFCRRRNSVSGAMELFDPVPFIASIRSEDGREDATVYGAPTELGKALLRNSIGVYVFTYILQANQIGHCELGGRGTLTVDGAAWATSQKDNYMFEVVPDPLSFADVG